MVNPPLLAAALSNVLAWALYLIPDFESDLEPKSRIKKIFKIYTADDTNLLVPELTSFETKVFLANS